MWSGRGRRHKNAIYPFLSLSQTSSRPSVKALRARWYVEITVVNRMVEVSNEKPQFRVFFLEDEDQKVEVVEVETIDFSEVKDRLKHGESGFITLGNRQKLNPPLTSKETVEESWYFARI